MPKFLVGGNEQKALPGPVVKSGGKVIFNVNQGKVHITFVFDTTGSMSNKIDALVATLIIFVREMTKLGLEVTFSLVSFGDLTVAGDRIEVEATNVADAEDFVGKLQRMKRNSGGGNSGESSLEAMQIGLSLQPPDRAVKVIVLITDEPALTHKIQPASIMSDITAREYLCFVLSPSNSYYKEMAVKNGGQWQPISASSSLDNLIEMFREMAKKIALISDDVIKLTHGNVPEYLRLTSGK
jgi:hypothetical protein